jgi:diphthine-ammonia ligase
MKLGVLFSGGKDSTLAAWLALKEGYEVSCLISIASSNKESFMFHTPSISKVGIQAEAMGIPVVVQETKGEKEVELLDLKKAIVRAKKDFGIEGVVTGAVFSVYQASRVEKICNDLDLEVFNLLWQKNEEELIKDLIKEKFDVRVVGVFAYPLNEKWLGRRVDLEFLEEMKALKEKWGINVAGEGGEYESFVFWGPIFKKKLEIVGYKDFFEGENSCRRELEVKISSEKKNGVCKKASEVKVK